MRHFVRFLKRVWERVKPPPLRTCGMIAIFSVLAGGVITGIVWVLARGLCWVADRPFSGEAMSAGMGVLMFIVLIVLSIEWLREQWRESAEKDIFEDIAESVTKVPVGCDPGSKDGDYTVRIAKIEGDGDLPRPLKKTASEMGMEYGSREYKEYMKDGMGEGCDPSKHTKGGKND